MKLLAVTVGAVVLGIACAACGGRADKELPPTEDVGPSTPRTGEEDLLASMLLTPEEVGDLLPGTAWTICGVAHAEEGDVLPPGAVTHWGVDVCSEGEDVVSMNAFLYETADSAGNAWNELWIEPYRDWELFDAGDIGDEAQGVVDGPPDSVGTGVSLRIGEVVAAVGIPSGTDEESRLTALQVAEKLAAKIEAILEAEAAR